MYVKRVSIFLTMVALIAGMVGCGQPAPSHDLTIASTGRGSVTTPGEGIFTYDEGTVVNLVASPVMGYRFVNWTGDVGTIANVNAATTTVTMNGDYSITANFVAIYDLTISSTGGGSVTTPGEGVFTYDAGTVVGLVAIPTSGYRFVNWTGNVSTVANVNSASTTITMNGNYSITANFEQDEVVTFPDPNLEAVIRGAIGKPTGPIYASDLEGLIELDASDRGISNLSGLEYCINLYVLDLLDNQITDISPLSSLNNLGWLNLPINRISNISALANLVNLVDLYLQGNQISDASALSALTNLEYLDLGSNQIGNLLPLAALANLKGLNLSSNQIGDVLPLASLANLQRLELENNGVSDLQPLSNLTNLIYLDASYNQISNILPLVDNEGLSEGDHVDLRSNPLSSDSINIYIPQLQARGVAVDY